MKRWLYASLCRLLIVTTAALSLAESAQAALITTDQAVSAGASHLDRDRLANLLARGDVREQLQTLGVNPADAKARVDAMGDDEVRQLASRMDALPAGGDSIVLVLILVLLIVLILRTR